MFPVFDYKDGAKRRQDKSQFKGLMGPGDQPVNSKKVMRQRVAKSGDGLHDRAGNHKLNSGFQGFVDGFFVKQDASQDRARQRHCNSRIDGHVGGAPKELGFFLKMGNGIPKACKNYNDWAGNCQYGYKWQKRARCSKRRFWNYSGQFHFDCTLEKGYLKCCQR